MASTRLTIRVLGSAAGGGFPQWNCHCPNCHGSRQQTIKALPRTQSSIALATNLTDWILVNASPDIRTQLASFPALYPERAIRDNKIAGVILVDSQLDHTLGLFSLREAQNLTIYLTDSSYRDLTTSLPLLPILANYAQVTHTIVTPGETIHLEAINGIVVEFVDAGGRTPPYTPERLFVPGATIGLLIRNTFTNTSLFYCPALSEITPAIYSAMSLADIIMVDGTFFLNDEMKALGINEKTAHDMGHLPLSGESGIIETLRGLNSKRKILIHINNTNPILNETSREAKSLANEGIELAFDGMEIII